MLSKILSYDNWILSYFFDFSDIQINDELSIIKKKYSQIFNKKLQFILNIVVSESLYYQ